MMHHSGRLCLISFLRNPCHESAHSASSHRPSADHARMHSTGRALELAAEGRRAARHVERLLCGKSIRNIAPRAKVHHAAPFASAHVPQGPLFLISSVQPHAHQRSVLL